MDAIFVSNQVMSFHLFTAIGPHKTIPKPLNGFKVKKIILQLKIQNKIRTMHALHNSSCLALRFAVSFSAAKVEKNEAYKLGVSRLGFTGSSWAGHG